MATKEEITLAGKLVFYEIVSREEMQATLSERDRLEKEGQDVDLAAMLLQKNLASRAELDALSGIPLTETQPIPEYRFRRKIAEGGMAAVYLASYRPLREEVALKVMKPELARSENYRLRFLRESKLLMKLEHRNIVKGFEIRRDSGYIFCAMEHVDGATVEERIDSEGPFDERLALYVVRETAKALTYLDHRGVVHRDIKPGNILITEDGTVKIIDLGLAKLRRGMSLDSAAGVTVGTVEYLSPEQARGLTDVDIRSDVYSLGVTLYHMLTGEVPFKGESAEEVIAKQVLQSLDAAALKSRKVSAFAHFFLQKMMAKDRGDRYQHPTDVIKEIMDQAGEVGDAFQVKKKFDIGAPGRVGSKPEGRTGAKGRTVAKGKRGRRTADRNAGRKPPGRRRRK